MKVLRGGSLILENGIKKGFQLVIEKGIIKSILPENHDVPARAEVYDVKGSFIAPGLIDLHVHGGAGFDVMDEDGEALVKIAEYKLKNGTTAFLPTLITSPLSNIRSAIEKIYKQSQKIKKGARIFGVYLEGPFISKEKKGAHPEQYIIPPDISFLRDIETEFPGFVKVIAVAPETDKNFEFIKFCHKLGVRVALGHSDSNYNLGVEALKAGAGSFIHLFNGMSGLHHRKPGMVGAALSSDAYVELIADGHHVHPAVVKIVSKCKSSEKIILITDACAAAGWPGDKVLRLGDQKIKVENGTARLEDGTIAGSVLTLLEAVRNVYRYSDLPLYRVFNMASLNPATFLGLEKERGSLASGKVADFIILDEELELTETWLNGQRVC